MNEKEAYIHIRNELSNAIDSLREKLPEAANYLSKNIIYNDEEMTVKYIGDDRISIKQLLKD